MPWNIIMGPALLCLVWGIFKGLKLKARKPLVAERRASLYG